MYSGTCKQCNAPLQSNSNVCTYCQSRQETPPAPSGATTIFKQAPTGPVLSGQFNAPVNIGNITVGNITGSNVSMGHSTPNFVTCLCGASGPFTKHAHQANQAALDIGWKIISGYFTCPNCQGE